MSLYSIYFPPVADDAKTVSTGGSSGDNKEVAEAKEIASRLPDVPKSDPGDNEHHDKKQKQ